MALACTRALPVAMLSRVKDRQYATITLIGRDRSGVIARITQALFLLGANIESLEEEVRRGQFRMTLQACWNVAQFSREIVARTLEKEARALGMELTLTFPVPGRQRLAVLVMKETHVWEALGREAGLGKKKPGRSRLGADPVVVIGSRPDLNDAVKHFGLPFHVVRYTDRSKAEAQILALLRKYEVDFMVLARFMKILSPDFVWRWKNKIINIHPSLLPAFPGANAYRQAYEKGVRVVGVTAHFVTPQLDEGPIIAQAAMTIDHDDSLASIVARGQALEAKCMVEAVKAYVAKRLDVYWGRVHTA